MAAYDGYIILDPVFFRFFAPDLLEQDPATVFKTLVVRGSSGAYYVFDIPVAENLDLKKAAKAVGEKSIAMLPQTWVEELQVTEDDLDSISGFPRTIDGVCVGVMIRNSEPGKAKLSVRTAPGYNASAYCGKLGGGGHHAAAGCAIPGTLEDGKAAMLAVLREENVI